MPMVSFSKPSLLWLVNNMFLLGLFYCISISDSDSKISLYQILVPLVGQRFFRSILALSYNRENVKLLIEILVFVLYPSYIKMYISVCVCVFVCVCVCVFLIWHFNHIIYNMWSICKYVCVCARAGVPNMPP